MNEAAAVGHARLDSKLINYYMLEKFSLFIVQQMFPYIKKTGDPF